MFGAAEAEGRTLDVAGVAAGDGRGGAPGADGREAGGRGWSAGAETDGLVLDAERLDEVLQHEEQEDEGALSAQHEVEREVRDGGR
jgi:hypothetical protein